MSSSGNAYGVELSMSRFDEVIFYGMYLDAVYDERESGTGRDYRFTVCPELGMMLTPWRFRLASTSDICQFMSPASTTTAPRCVFTYR